MITRLKRDRVYYSAHQKEAVRDAVVKTMSKKGIVISYAKTAKEICSVQNYNCSIELPVGGTKKM